jgi:phage terminase small subunit
MARMNAHQAIELVTREARRAWDQVAPGLRRRGILDARSALGLAFCCQQVAQYRCLLEAGRRWPEDREIARALEGARLAAREAAAEFSLIPMRRIRMAPLNPQGQDLDLLRIFGRPAA